MACLEITCAMCSHTWFSNANGEKCPVCGNDQDNHVWFDEEELNQPDDHEGEEEYD